MPVVNTKNNITQIIKNIENNIIKLGNELQTEVRNRSIPVIHNLLSRALYKDPTDFKIMKSLQITKKFMKNNPNIIFTKADKGGVTVALDKNEYTHKIDEMLNDNDTYIKIKKDPIKKLTSDIRSMLARWRSKGYINNGTYSRIYCSDGNLPRAHGLPKIHKPSFTFRFIISSIDSPTHSLANYLHDIKTQLNLSVT